MTATPSMTPKTSLTGVLLACAGAVALIVVLQLVGVPGTGGWRQAGAAQPAMAETVKTRGSNALFDGAALDAGGISAARGRN